MKTMWGMGTIVGLAFLIALGNSRALAQAEVDPDHYETTNSPPSRQPTRNAQAARIHYHGNFTLPYRMRCKDKSLPPGKYSVSLDSDGKTAAATFNSQGRAVRIDGIAQRPAPNQGKYALVVERWGNMRQLAAIRVERLDLVVRPSSAEEPSPMTARGSEELPLTLTDPKK